MMTKTDIYNSDYTKLNHSYIEIYNTYKKLAEADDADAEVMDVLGKILIVFNPILDKIKSEMTVETRFKNPDEKNQWNSASGETGYSSKKAVKVENKNGTIILHGNFTGE